MAGDEEVANLVPDEDVPPIQPTPVMKSTLSLTKTTPYRLLRPQATSSADGGRAATAPTASSPPSRRDTRSERSGVRTRDGWRRRMRGSACGPWRCHFIPRGRLGGNPSRPKKWRQATASPALSSAPSKTRPRGPASQETDPSVPCGAGCRTKFAAPGPGSECRPGYQTWPTVAAGLAQTSCRLTI